MSPAEGTTDTTMVPVLADPTYLGHRAEETFAAHPIPKQAYIDTLETRERRSAHFENSGMLPSHCIKAIIQYLETHKKTFQWAHFPQDAFPNHWFELCSQLFSYPVQPHTPPLTDVLNRDVHMLGTGPAFLDAYERYAAELRLFKPQENPPKPHLSVYIDASALALPQKTDAADATYIGSLHNEIIQSLQKDRLRKKYPECQYDLQVLDTRIPQQIFRDIVKQRVKKDGLVILPLLDWHRYDPKKAEKNPESPRHAIIIEDCPTNDQWSVYDPAYPGNKTNLVDPQRIWRALYKNQFIAFGCVPEPQ